MNRVYLSRLTYIGPEGAGLISEGLQSWQELGFESTTTDTNQINSGSEELPKLKATWFFKDPFMKFGRMDRYTQLVLAAAQTCLNASPINGIVLGSAWGSNHQDQIHCRDVLDTGKASPATFTYTLPSVALGEISILRQHHGENIMVEAAETSGLQALHEAFWLVHSGRVKQCLVIAADYLDPSKARAWACLLNSHAGELEILNTQSHFQTSSTETTVGLGDAGFNTLRDFILHRDLGPHSLREVSSSGHVLEFSLTLYGESS